MCRGGGGQCGLSDQERLGDAGDEGLISDRELRSHSPLGVVKKKKDFRGKQYLNWVLRDLDRPSRGAMMLASLVAQRVKNLPTMWETWV